MSLKDLKIFKSNNDCFHIYVFYIRLRKYYVEYKNMCHPRCHFLTALDSSLGAFTFYVDTGEGGFFQISTQVHNPQ